MFFVVRDIWCNELFCVMHAEYINRISSAVGLDIKYSVMNPIFIKHDLTPQRVEVL